MRPSCRPEVRRETRRTGTGSSILARRKDVCVSRTSSCQKLSSRNSRLFHVSFSPFDSCRFKINMYGVCPDKIIFSRIKNKMFVLFVLSVKRGKISEKRIIFRSVLKLSLSHGKCIKIQSGRRRQLLKNEPLSFSKSKKLLNYIRKIDRVFLRILCGNLTCFHCFAYFIFT